MRDCFFDKPRGIRSFFFLAIVFIIVAGMLEKAHFSDLCPMHPKDLSIVDFTYMLPQDRIALHPAHPRDGSKLLIYDKGTISTDIYRHLDQHLPADVALVFNDTRVIKSRLHFPKRTGAVIEVFCLEPYGDFIDYETQFRQTGEVRWKCMIGKAGKWKEKQLSKSLIIGGKKVTLNAELVKKLPDAYVVRFAWWPEEVAFGEIIHAAGATPLPPYIKRSVNKKDEKDYQTVYSAHDGSVAAPTAGLHFTGEMMHGFSKKKIPVLFTTLHVGAGTFKPVKSNTMGEHVMHAEWMNISVGFLDELLKNMTNKIISIGTTATRTLESIYWMGNKILNNKNIKEERLRVSQWEVYDSQKCHDPQDAVAALLEWISKRDQTHLLIETGIIIAPGYDFKIVKGLVSNFHQPKSTLLLLVAALVGNHWKEIYDYALAHDFRFLSYGDGCLLLP